MLSDGIGDSVNSSGCGGLADSYNLPNHVLKTAGCIESKGDQKLCNGWQRSLPSGRILDIVSYFVDNTQNVVSAESKPVVQFDVVVNVDWIGVITENAYSFFVAYA